MYVYIFSCVQILGEGGTYICRVYELLTRFSAGIIYLMYKLFDEVSHAACSVDIAVEIVMYCLL